MVGNLKTWGSLSLVFLVNHPPAIQSELWERFENTRLWVFSSQTRENCVMYILLHIWHGHGCQIILFLGQVFIIKRKDYERFTVEWDLNRIKYIMIIMTRFLLPYACSLAIWINKVRSIGSVTWFTRPPQSCTGWGHFICCIWELSTRNQYINSSPHEIHY